MRDNFVSERRGFIHHSKGNFLGRKQGAGIKAIVHHRHQNHHDPNVEILKDSLQKLSLKGQSRLSAQPKGAAIKKKSKYIVF
jgi:hypothetical protein